MQGKRVHSRRRKSAFPGALGRSKGRSSIGRFPRFSCGALKRRSFEGPRKRVPSCAGNTSAAKPPCAPPSASDEPPSFLFHPARSSIQKNEHALAHPPASGILRRQSRLVRRLRRRTNRRVSSSTRQGHRKQKLSRQTSAQFVVNGEEYPHMCELTGKEEEAFSASSISFSTCTT